MYPPLRIDAGKGCSFGIHVSSPLVVSQSAIPLHIGSGGTIPSYVVAIVLPLLPMLFQQVFFCVYLARCSASSSWIAPRGAPCCALLRLAAPFSQSLRARSCSSSPSCLSRRRVPSTRQVPVSLTRACSSARAYCYGPPSLLSQSSDVFVLFRISIIPFSEASETQTFLQTFPRSSFHDFSHFLKELSHDSCSHVSCHLEKEYC